MLALQVCDLHAPQGNETLWCHHLWRYTAIIPLLQGKQQREVK